MVLGLADCGYVRATGRVTHQGTGQGLLDDPAVRKSYLGGHMV